MAKVSEVDDNYKSFEMMKVEPLPPPADENNNTNGDDDPPAPKVALAVAIKPASVPPTFWSDEKGNLKL